MIRVVQAFGRELSAAAPTELTIGNVVRRVLFCIREEHSNQLNALREQEEKEKRPRGASKDYSARRTTRSNSLTSDKRDRSNSTTSVNSDTNSNSAANTPHNMNPLQPIAEIGSSSGSARVTIRDSVDVVPSANYNSGQHNASLLKISHHFDSMLSHLDARNDDADELQRQFPSLKSAVIAAVNELSTEVDTYAAICQRAQDFIHADETILTYGYSKIVELFLKAACNKRRFQLIIAESAPTMSGHKLAQIVSQFPNQHNIAVTLIPDSNIYAIMARVNKVILAPQAIMADGGCIASAGQLMCATAAREFSIPVVCCAGAFSLTPLFAHNQTVALQQLLCPAHVFSTSDLGAHGELQKHIVEENVTVLHPAFDHLTPDLIAIYVTNDGSHLPTYVFRHLSEYYHPKDYTL
jgi:translation initiation factor eIF-2B subunit beta